MAWPRSKLTWVDEGDSELEGKEGRQIMHA